jgi:hypothetical protein
MNLAKDLHGVPPKRVPVLHGAHNDLGITLLTDETCIERRNGRRERGGRSVKARQQWGARSTPYSTPSTALHQPPATASSPPVHTYPPFGASRLPSPSDASYHASSLGASRLPSLYGASRLPAIAAPTPVAPSPRHSPADMVPRAALDFATDACMLAQRREASAAEA